MALLDYFIPSSITARLTDLLLGQRQIETRLSVIEQDLQYSILTGDQIMTTLTEIKDLTVTAFAENTESLQLAITKIDELKARLPDPADGALADQIAESLRGQIAANDEFQAKLNPPAEPTS